MYVSMSVCAVHYGQPPALTPLIHYVWVQQRKYRGSHRLLGFASMSALPK